MFYLYVTSVSVCECVHTTQVLRYSNHQFRSKRSPSPVPSGKRPGQDYNFVQFMTQDYRVLWRVSALLYYDWWWAGWWKKREEEKDEEKTPTRVEVPKKTATHSSEGRCDLLDMSSLCCRFFNLFQFSKTVSTSTLAFCWRSLFQTNFTAYKRTPTNSRSRSGSVENGFFTANWETKKSLL